MYTHKGACGKDVHHHYCSNCGVNVCGNTTAGGFYTVTATSVDGGWPGKPKAAIYAASAQSWPVLPTDIPVFEALPPIRIACDFLK